jgi:hypothetical protein
MANRDSNAIQCFSSNQHLRELQLFSLISTLCAPRQSRPASDMCRLIVDSRLQWAVEPIDGNTSWLYLPHAAHARQLAGCTVLTVN